MILNLFFSQPLLFILWLLSILYALTVHEFSHALASYLLGDSTARDLGRLTLNPLAHLDFLGFLMLLLVGFGWGKPVPYNPYNLRDKRLGPALVGLAGPLANFLSLLIFGFILKVLSGFLGSENLLFQFLSFLMLINLVLLVFNLIPIPPLDGSKILFSLLPSSMDHLRIILEERGPFLLLTLLILDRVFSLNIFSQLFQGIFSLVSRIF